MEYEELKRLMREQKVEMTAEERMKAYNAGEEVDHIPYTLQAPDPAMAYLWVHYLAVCERFRGKK